LPNHSPGTGSKARYVEQNSQVTPINLLPPVMSRRSRGVNRRSMALIRSFEQPQASRTLPKDSFATFEGGIVRLSEPVARNVAVRVLADIKIAEYDAGVQKIVKVVWKEGSSEKPLLWKSIRPRSPIGKVPQGGRHVIFEHD
jgi:hypothetical protein